MLSTLLRFPTSLQNMENLRHVLMVLCISIPPCRPVSRNLNLSIFQSSHLRTFDFWTLGGRYKFLCTGLTTLSFIDNARIDRITQMLQRIFPRAPRAGVTPSWRVSSSLERLVFCSAIGAPSLEVASWPPFDMALCFPIGSERKLMKLLQKKHRQTHVVDQTKKKVPLVKLSHWLACQQLVLTCFIWIFGSKLILSNNQLKGILCVLDTWIIVGLLSSIIILIVISLTSKMYNWDSPSKVCVCWWVRNRHLTIDQHLACSFQLVLWSLNGLLSRTSFLRLAQSCSFVCWT